LKRYDEAAKMFEKAVQMNPNYPLAIGNLADAYRWSGRTGEAMATYDKAIALAYKELQVNPRDASAMQHLAQYYSRKGDLPQALEFIRRAKSIDPANASLLYTQAVVYSLTDRQDEALKTLNEALQKGFSLEAVKNDPELNKLRTNPQFAQLLNRFGK
jgi:tetratricopeptide (TPR) repeat protein